MADVNKIKLPDNTIVNIKDYRISGIDTTPTSGSTNPVTSGGVKTALDGYLPLSGGTLSGDLTIATDNANSPTLNFVRGTATDTYTDWRIQNNGGVLYFDNYTSGQWNNRFYFSGTSLTPYSNVVDGVSNLTLGTSNYQWSGVYAKDAYLSGALYLTSNIWVKYDATTGTLQTNASSIKLMANATTAAEAQYVKVIYLQDESDMPATPESDVLYLIKKS